METWQKHTMEQVHQAIIVLVERIHGYFTSNWIIYLGGFANYGDELKNVTKYYSVAQYKTQNGGTQIEPYTVKSNNENQYPDDNVQNNVWYVKQQE